MRRYCSNRKRHRRKPLREAMGRFERMDVIEDYLRDIAMNERAQLDGVADVIEQQIMEFAPEDIGREQLIFEAQVIVLETIERNMGISINGVNIAEIDHYLDQHNYRFEDIEMVVYDFLVDVVFSKLPAGEISDRVVDWVTKDVLGRLAEGWPEIEPEDVVIREEIAELLPAFLDLELR